MAENPLVEQIRRKFPKPVFGFTPNTNRRGTYCVGGAVLLHYYDNTVWAGKHKRFPEPFELVPVLQGLNSCLSHAIALDAAGRITRLNDLGYFEEAWQEVADALSYLEPPESAE